MQKAYGPGKELEFWNAIEPNAAGIDVGATEIFVAVPPERDPRPVRCFPPSPPICAPWQRGLFSAGS